MTCRAPLLAVLVLTALGLAQDEAAAQRRGRGSLFSGPVEAGLRGSRDFENHAWGLGTVFRIPVGRALELRPGADAFFPRDEETGWQLSADAAIRLGQGGGLYAGGGFTYLHLAESDGTESGYNLFFGLSTGSPAQRARGFIEFRWSFYDDTSPFRLAVGFTQRLW